MDFPPCPCGKPWGDLEQFSPESREHVEELVRILGEYVRVTIRGPQDRTWIVPRRCIAYHGITGKQLLSGTSGFEEVIKPLRKKK